MSLRHFEISYDALDNASDYLLGSDALDPLQQLLAAELELEAEIAGYDSVGDYLIDNPHILVH
jgi:hypothetical protein